MPIRMGSTAFKSDGEALGKLAEGDLSAYRFLFDRHFADLCNFLNIYCRSKEVSEEIALELFGIIWEKRGTLLIRISFRSYLFSAARYRAISHLRKTHRQLFANLDHEANEKTHDPDSLHLLEVNELRTILETALNQLPAQNRRIFLMAREEDLSHKEIAERLNLSPKTVENQVGIALKKLRESLLPYYKQLFISLILCLLL